MKLGQQMIRQDDGQKGLVAQQAGELRIVYLDRGEPRVAGKGEKWVPDELPQGPLRAEERLMVAHYADRALRAIDLHEPHKTWEKINLSWPIHDLGLVNAIVAYLGDRHGPPGPR
jgi:hypothetical protein